MILFTELAADRNVVIWPWPSFNAVRSSAEPSAIFLNTTRYIFKSVG